MPPKPDFASFGTSRERRVGFTILELIIYISLSMTLLLPITAALLSSNRLLLEGGAITSLMERNRVAFNRIGEDLRDCLRDTIAIDGPGKTITFTLPGNFTGIVPTGGDVISYSIQPDPEDAPNFTDDDGDGIVDESVFIRTNNTTGESVTITAFLESGSCLFSRVGNGIQVSLATMDSERGSNDVIKWTKTMVFFPRN